MEVKQNHLVASVLICTRNRATYLSNTIQVAAAQKLSCGRFEIVVVDNGSTDSTREVVRVCQSAITNVSLRYVVEEEVGLSAARNRAIQEARGQILCFLDDDAEPEAEWLEWLVLGFAASPSVMCVGGTIVPVYEAAPPVWFSQGLELIFKPEILGVDLHQVTYPYYPYGANFSIRSEAVKHVGTFNTSLGYKGRDLIPCEETEFLLRIEKAGYEIFMEPRAVVRHIIPANRLTRDYLRLRQYAYGKGCTLVKYFHQNQPYEDAALFSQVCKLAILGVQNIKIRVRYWRQFMRHRRVNQPELFYQQCCLAMDLGISDIQWKILWNQICGRPFER